MEERVAEREGVGVVEGAEDDPDGFVAAFFCEDFVEEYECGLGEAFLGHRGWGGFEDGLFDVSKVGRSERLSEAFGLEVLHFFVAEVAVMVAVGEVEDSLERCDASRF